MANLISGNHIITESTEMYLLRIAQLQQERSPVPIPLLAQELSVSPVSANEMCRKLTQREFITYEPYKGVTLTAQGADLAQRVLHHRRLWEVFLVEKLGMSTADAEDMACRFEHITSTDLAARLANFLHPHRSANDTTVPLTTLHAGDSGIIAQTEPNHHALTPLNVTAGSRVTVLAIAENGTRLVATAGGQVALAALLAAEIHIIAKDIIHV